MNCAHSSALLLAGSPYSAFDWSWILVVISLKASRFLAEHELLDVVQGDVAAGLGIVKTPVGVLLDNSNLLRHKLFPHSPSAPAWLQDRYLG
jgi:hypothetical protein